MDARAYWKLSKGALSGEMAAWMRVGGGDGSRGSKISKPGGGEEMSGLLVWKLLQNFRIIKATK